MRVHREVQTENGRTKHTERQRQTQQESRRESKSAITLTTHGAHTLGQEGI